MSASTNPRKSAHRTPPNSARTRNSRSTGTRSKRKKRSLRTNYDSTSSGSEEDLPITIDKNTEIGLRNAAARNNLTSDIVRNIIRKVCHNDHVLALVRYKEEEANKSSELQNQLEAVNDTSATAENRCIDNRDKDQSNSLNADVNVSHSDHTAFVPQSTGDEFDDDDEDDCNASSADQQSPFKLTRAKARALNKQPLPILPLPPASCVHQPPPEIASIIAADLRSDDDDDENDEEYRPDDDDVPSDDDFTVTASDLESQPATPASLWDTSLSLSSPPPSMHHTNCSMSPRLTSDGHFKIPQRISFSRPQSRNQADQTPALSADYIIAQQTRSKVSLATTPIEIIEANFQPPDVDSAENVDCSITSEYMQFLKDTISDSQMLVEEDDADDDEDFMLPCVDTPVADREEMYNRPIPQQECLDLFDDLLNYIDSASMNSHPELQTLIKQLDGPDTTANAINTHIRQPAATANGIVDATAVAETANPAPPPPETSESSRSPQRSHNYITHRANRLYRHLATEPPPSDYQLVDADGVGSDSTTFLDWQLALLQQQLRIHVQLSIQAYLQVYGHPANGLWQFADTYKGFLEELNDEQFGDDDLRIVNLRPALGLLTSWESDRSVRNRENREFIRYLEYHTEKSKRMAEKCSPYAFFFHPLVSAAMLESRSVFVYAHLLPPAPLRVCGRGQFFKYRPTEDFQLALGLERFYALLRQSPRVRKRSAETGDDVPLSIVCKRIEVEMMPWRRGRTRSVYKYVVRRRNLKSSVINPIQYYFKHGKAPAIKHVLHPFDETVDTLSILDRDLQMVNRSWTAAADQLKKAAATVESNQTLNSTFASNNQTLDSTFASQTPSRIRARRASLLQVACANCSHVSTLDSSILLDRDSDQIRTITIDSDAGPIFVTTIVCSEFEDHIADEPLDSIAAEGQHQSVTVERENRTAQQRHCVRKLEDLLHRFVDPLQREKKLLDRKHPLLSKVWSAVVTLDVYVRIFGMHSLATTGSATMTGESTANTMPAAAATDPNTPDSNGYAVLSPTQTAPIAANNDPHQSPEREVTNTIATVAANKRTPAACKTTVAQSNRLLLTADSTDDFAQNFLDRIESIYSPASTTASSQPSADRYAEFLRILNSFDARTSSAVDLYARCEAFFLPDHPELAEAFLTFLLPSDAARLGRFVDHLIMDNMSHFIGKLQTYLQKQPAQLRKILGALKDLADEQPAMLTVERIRAKIVPMLRGNALLIEWFQQCFASDSMGAEALASDLYETMVMVPKTGVDYYAASDAMDAIDNVEAYEEIAAGDLLPDPAEHPCHIRFMNGHIYYGSKIVLPVQLSFQSVQYSSVVSPVDATTATTTTTPSVESDDELSEAAEGSASSYVCVHEIKRIGDKKLNTLYAGPDDVNETTTTTTSTGNVSDPSAVADADEANTTAVASSSNVDKCCNDVLLKAHAVRLNPTQHGSQLRRPSDLLDLLKRPSTASGTSAGEKSGSPKKRNANTVETTANGTPSSSPPKKCKLKRSKARKQTTAAKTLVLRESPATLATESPSSDCPTDTPIKIDLDAVEATNTANPLEPLVDIKVDVDDDNADANNIDICSPRLTEPPPESPDLWSRDEDKIVLEQIQCGFATEDELVQTLLQNGRLPNRTADEIHVRFAFLMDIIANL